MHCVLNVLMCLLIHLPLQRIAVYPVMTWWWCAFHVQCGPGLKCSEVCWYRHGSCSCEWTRNDGIMFWGRHIITLSWGVDRRLGTCMPEVCFFGGLGGIFDRPDVPHINITFYLPIRRLLTCKIERQTHTHAHRQTYTHTHARTRGDELVYISAQFWYVELFDCSCFKFKIFERWTSDSACTTEF